MRLNQPRVVPSHSFPTRAECLSKHSIQAGRLNLDPSQVTASKHRAPRSIRIGVRVLVGWLTLGGMAKTHSKINYQASNRAR